ncbi:hypothetical protein DUNSADRAFT_6452 [Dunaliella salina]|uniref:Encoded protein n=1 Tax=Dunaliella salina TaxID=3046 RepID=A0ABQ7H6X1_DUNSA|nr:hypothetical protein DUNSADRAFT_6452 [Dunaliella salina]|eukprot:KAF5842602.1 hypothetical protein DUNSADRAFT_6452 [Dunaliella salina]
MHMDWRSKVRIIIHMGDQPQHGTDFHDMPANEDNFPNGDPEGRDLRAMLEYLRHDCKVNLYTFIHLYSTPSTLKMLRQFRQNCRASRWIEECHVDQYSSNFSSSILDNVSSTIRNTIQQSRPGR